MRRVFGVVCGLAALACSEIASHAAALTALLATPSKFYVNFHSDNCPGGFARGFLP
jgi:hypothetical protein